MIHIHKDISDTQNLRLGGVAFSLPHDPIVCVTTETPDKNNETFCLMPPGRKQKKEKTKTKRKLEKPEKHNKKTKKNDSLEKAPRIKPKKH